MEEVNIVSFSGGKDSTAMLLMMIEKGIKIDEILFCDTGVEFPAMYTHIKKVEEYIGRPITILHNKGFEYFMFEHQKSRGKFMDLKGFGFPHATNRWCTANLKVRVMDKYLKKKYKGKKVNRFIGIAFDERERERV